MKKYINFRNFGVVCFAVLVILVLCSFSGIFNSNGHFTSYEVKSIRVDGQTYIVGVTNKGGIAICPATK